MKVTHTIQVLGRDLQKGDVMFPTEDRPVITDTERTGVFLIGVLFDTGEILPVSALASYTIERP